MKFSAVILAGGKSSRMGRDKAFLSISGKTRLARQIETVRAAGAAEIGIAGTAEINYSEFGCRVLVDKFQNAGPLAGIEAALAAVTNPLLLVLAVDVQMITSEFIRRLAFACVETTGVVPRVNGNIEPLVAIYPKAARVVAERRLSRQSHAVKDFVTDCAQSSLAAFVDFPTTDATAFKNFNSPADLPCLV